MPIYEELIQEIKSYNRTPKQLAQLKRSLCVKHKIEKPPTNFDILLHAQQKDLPVLKKKLLLKPVRTASGVTPVAIMTAPFACPHGKCTFCPGGPNSYYGDMPQGYTGHEPTTMRAIRNKYDSYLQVFNRLEQYVALGHNCDKIELIVMGGTFPALEQTYQDEFIWGALKAMNDFSELFFEKRECDFEKFKDFFELPGEIGSKERTENIHKKALDLKNKTTLQQEQERNETSKI